VIPGGRQASGGAGPVGPLADRSLPAQVARRASASGRHVAAIGTGPPPPTRRRTVPDGNFCQRSQSAVTHHTQQPGFLECNFKIPLDRADGLPMHPWLVRHRASTTTFGLFGRLVCTAVLLGVPIWMIFYCGPAFVVALIAWVIVAPRFLRDVWREADTPAGELARERLAFLAPLVGPSAPSDIATRKSPRRW
jgi:hypothetical protein